jgi:hypothetical protein
MQKLIFEKAESIELYYVYQEGSNQIIGEIHQEIDGFHYFWPKTQLGLTDDILIPVGAKIKELNIEADKNFALFCEEMEKSGNIDIENLDV